MPWVNLGEINVVKSWAFTTSTETEVFRISHLSPASGENLRAVVAQGFYDEGDTPNIFNPKIISPKFLA